jgi:hypothetical protein
MDGKLILYSELMQPHNSKGATTMKRLTQLLIIGASLVLMLGLFSGKAHAGFTTSCSVTVIFYDPGLGSGRLSVTCGGTNYYANPGGTCHTNTLEDTKLWYSMSMAAYLSGKSLQISFEDPAGSCGSATIYSLQIQN